MKFFGSVLLLSMAAGNVAGMAQSNSQNLWSLFPPARAETVKIQNAGVFSASEPVELRILIGLPAGCHKAEVLVRHPDEFTHIIKPDLYPATSPCVQISRYDHQTIRIGTLPPGEHRIIVENVTRSVPESTILVAEDPATTGGI